MRSRCKILVLGQPVTAQVISQRLRALGYETFMQTAVGLDRLPPVGEQESLRVLKDVLVEFASQIGIESGNIGLVHPGVSAWAERPELIPLARRLDLRVIGPPARIQYLFGNQLFLLGEAEKLGVPNLIQSVDPMYTLRELEEFLARSGQKFPFVLRAVRGSGSLSSVLVRDETFLATQLTHWFEQLRRNLGEVIFIVERHIEGARQVLVPFVRFRNGRIQIFPTSDVSLQSRRRKLVEFCPAPSLDPQVQIVLRQWTAHLTERFEYVGLGHFEFLVDGTRIFLKSGATRLNTGFHLWEEIAGTNALAWQMAAADLQAIHPEIPPEMISRDRWRQGLMLKILCEDSRLLLPRPGVLAESSLPVLRTQEPEELQFVQNYVPGQRVDPDDSGTVAHLYAFSTGVERAVNLGFRALHKAWFAGGLQTNERFLTELMNHPWVREGMFHSEFVDEEFLPACIQPAEWLPAIVQAVSQHIVWSDSSEAISWAVNGRRVSSLSDSGMKWRWVGQPRYWIENGLPGVSGEIERLESADAEASEDERVLRFCAFPLEEGRWNVRLGTWYYNLRRLPSRSSDQPIRRVSEEPSVAAPVGLTHSKLHALVTGRVQALFFREGATANARQPVLMIESLGSYVAHSLPFSIRVTHWRVSANDQVIIGQILAEFEVLPS